MASKRRLRRKGCGRKIRYTSQAEALAGLKALTREKGHQGYLTPYHCQFCNGYHFGHPPRRVRQALGI